MKFASLLVVGISLVAPSIALSAEGEVPAERKNFYGRPIPDKAITRLGTAVINLREISDNAEFTPDGKTIAVRRRGDSVELWDISSGALLRQIGDGPEKMGLRFAPDGKTLVILTGALQLEFWEFPAGKLRNTAAIPVALPDEMKRPGQARAEFAVSPDSKLVATVASDGSLSIFQLADGHHLLGRELTLPEKERMGSCSLSFSRDSKRIAVVGGQGNIFVYDIPADRIVHTLTNAHSEFCSFVAFANDDQLLISCGRDRSKPSMERLSECRVWSMTDGSRVNEATFEEHPWPRLTANGKEFWVGTADAVELWEIDTLTRMRTIRLPGRPEGPVPTHLMSLSSDGKLAAVGGLKGFEILDLVGEKLRTYDVAAHRDLVYSIQYTNDGGQIVTSGRDGTIRSWDATTGKQLQNFAAPQQTTFQEQSLVSSDGRTMYAVASPPIDQPTAGKFFIAYDIPTGMERFRIPISSANLEPLAVSADGRFVALSATAGRNRDVKVVDLVEKKVSSEFEAPDSLEGVAFLSGGTAIVGVTGNFTLRHWAPDGKQTETFNILGDDKPFRTQDDRFTKRVRVNRIGEAIFATGRSLCVTQSSRSDKLVGWNLQTGKKAIEIPLGSAEPVELAVSRDERWLAAASDFHGRDRSQSPRFRIFDIESGELRADFQRTGEAPALAFSPDNKRLAVAQRAPYDIIVWDLSQELKSPGE